MSKGHWTCIRLYFPDYFRTMEGKKFLTEELQLTMDLVTGHHGGRLTELGSRG